jgi:hypothetical protein
MSEIVFDLEFNLEFDYKDEQSINKSFGLPCIEFTDEYKGYEMLTEAELNELRSEYLI